MNYVISDIHGRKEKYDKMIKQLKINDNDTLYILGDVIDRGEEGIKIILDIMKHDNYKMILGNHELMMLEALHAYDLAGAVPTFENVEWYKKKAEHWMYSNGGFITHVKYRDLSKQKQKEVREYLDHLPVILPDVVVNGNHYYMAHASFSKDYPADYTKPIYKEEMTREDLRDVIWDRFTGVDFAKRYGHPEVLKGKKMIIGHTPTVYLSGGIGELHLCNILIEEQYIDVDCGCANPKDEYARLGVLRLDDMAEFYF